MSLDLLEKVLLKATELVTDEFNATAEAPDDERYAMVVEVAAFVRLAEERLHAYQSEQRFTTFYNLIEQLIATIASSAPAQQHALAQSGLMRFNAIQPHFSSEQAERIAPLRAQLTAFLEQPTPGPTQIRASADVKHVMAEVEAIETMIL